MLFLLSLSSWLLETPYNRSLIANLGTGLDSLAMSIRFSLYLERFE